MENVFSNLQYPTGQYFRAKRLGQLPHSFFAISASSIKALSYCAV